MKFKKRASIKATMLSAAAIATSMLIGFAACSVTEEEQEEDKTVTKQDVQVIKNGNFEFYDDNDGLYPISSPDNWTAGSSGSTSSAMSGIIDTAKDRWDYFTDPTLPATLEENDDLSSDDENKKDYNGAMTDDMPYKNTHDATNSDATAEDKAYIDNPFTHNYSYNEEGKLINLSGSTVTTYEKDGKTYLDSEYTEELETSVLMLHNYRPSYFKGTETYYTSTSTVTLEARTAATLSVWVKTTELYFDGTKNERTAANNEHGAYIKVDTSVGGNTLDNFFIRNINTEVLNPDGENNGWVKFTVFVQATSFASTSVTVTLGLGQNEDYTVEGYAFFDDLTIETYENESAMIDEAEKTLGEGNFAAETKNSTSYLLSPDAESEFRVDKVSFKTDGANGDLTDKEYLYNSANRYFYIDLTSSNSADSAVALKESALKGGLTVEKTANGKYVSSKDAGYARAGMGVLDNGAGNAYLPSGLKGRNTAKDLLASFTISEESWVFNANGDDYIYNDILTEALKTAASLPGANGSTTAMVMLSANGAAYEAELSDSVFSLDAGEYALVTFWLKTSDMDGKTAATVTVKEVGNEDENSANFTLDTTTLDGVTINDKEDFYNGWAECFIRVQNTAKDGKKDFSLTFNFGNTTISGTSETNYKSGWLAVANVSFMKLEEEVYDYTSNLTNVASLTISDEQEQSNKAFDSEKGDKNVIKQDLAVPSSYTGANGGSAEVVNIHAEPTDYDETNRNAYAGLLNRENLENYKSCDWFSAITALTKLQDPTDDDIWNALAGRYSVQPLIIVNAVRTFAEETAIYNYGYIGNNSTLSADSYTAVSVRVKVSEGAIANVYLVDTDRSSKQTLSFSLPRFTFWYDDDGNILKGEPKDKASVAELKENIAYTLRSDGLYDSVENDGKLYANFYNLEKKFNDLDFEPSRAGDITYYDESGNAVAFDDLTDGEIYFANAELTAYAPHYLIANGNKVYKYNEGLGDAATYYYMVGDEASEKLVYGVDPQKAQLRYDNTEGNDYPYKFTIDATTEEGIAKYAGKWVTVTFFLHSGSEEKTYKLELWSGNREEKTTENVAEGSYVLFDYDSVSLNETSYNNLINYYSGAIADEYRKVITDEQAKLSDNIADYERQLDAETVASVREKAFNYVAEYYTYTLYDSDLYVPFNSDTAGENETGYAYNYSDYSESLAYLRVEDSVSENESVMYMFADYSLFDKDISVGTAATVEPETDDNSTTSSEDVNFWLLLSSILLLVAILIALIVILGRDLYKKFGGRRKSSAKNTYNFNKNKRYVRKYVKANGEVNEGEKSDGKVEEGEVDEALLTDKPEETEETEETEAETPAEEAEQPAEEAAEQPAEDNAEATEDKPAEESKEETPAETPVETPAETPVEEKPEEDKPAEGNSDEDKQ